MTYIKVRLGYACVKKNTVLRNVTLKKYGCIVPDMTGLKMLAVAYHLCI